MHQAEHAPRERFVDRFVAERTPDFIAPSVTSISPSFIREHGIKALFLDVEGTFVQQGELEPDRATLTHLDRLRNDGGIQKIVLVTNKRVKNLETFVTLSHWGRMSRAVMVTSPLDSSWRKPNPTMITEAASRLGLDTGEVLMAGDRLTADIRAANAAGVTSVWLPEPFGGQDLIGDRVFRRPYERALAERMDVPKLSYEGANDYEPAEPPQYARSGTFDTIDWWSREAFPQELASIENVLLGFGIPFDGQVRDQILGSQWLYENGGQVADVLSAVRPLLKVVSASLEIGGHPKSATAIKILASLTDMEDGPLARHSRRGPTKEGARKDERNDKIARFIDEVGQVIAGNLEPTHLYSRTAADIAMNEIRNERGRNGHQDVGTSVFGQLATWIVEIANDASPILNESNPLLAAILHEVASDAKVLRIPGNVYYMEKREREREKKRPQLAAIAEHLALTA